MQQKQPPQYVTHRAQQELIKEFFMASERNSLEIQRPPSSNAGSNLSCNQLPNRNPRNYHSKLGQVQNQESTLSADCLHINQPNCSISQKQRFLSSTLPINEPQSAQMPRRSGAGLNSGQMIKSNGYVNICSARGQYQSRHETMQPVDRNQGCDQVSFTQTNGINQNGTLINSQNEESLTSDNKCQFQNEGSSQAHFKINKRPSQFKVIEQNSYVTSHTDTEKDSYHQQVAEMSAFQNESQRTQNQDKCEYSKMSTKNSQQTGRDFADMVSLETVNYLKQKQNSTSPNYKLQQQNYQTSSWQMASGLLNYQMGEYNEIENKTATNKSVGQIKNVQKLKIKDQAKQGLIVQTNNQTMNKFGNQGMQGLKHRASEPTATGPQDLNQVNFQRVVPQMQMKSFCNALNSQTNSHKVQFQSNNIHSQNKDQLVNGVLKQPKSQDRAKHSANINQGSYSPFQTRLYQQYQQSVPQDQIDNGQIRSNPARDLTTRTYSQHTEEFNQPKKILASMTLFKICSF